MAKVTPRANRSAKPGTEDAKGKKEKVERVPYPGLKVDENGKSTVKVEAVPDDFDPKKHKPLKKNDFKFEHVFLRLRADEYEAKAKAFREQADLSEKLGSSADRQKANKLKKMQDKMAELRKELEAQGINVDELLTGAEEDE